MSVIEGKRVTFVGSQIPATERLLKALKTERAQISNVSCAITPDNLSLLKDSDLIILNEQTENQICFNLLAQLQSSRQTNHIPVITFVSNIEAKINQVLMLGAADYLVPTENIDSMLQKIKGSFGFPNTYEGVSKVDLTETNLSPVTDGVKVYVIEDDPLLRALLAAKFDMSSVVYDFSHDGINVAEKIRNFCPSAILLDIMISAVNGLDILEVIKQTPDLSKIPVVVFSNQDSDDERRRAASLGASNYLVKATTDLSDLVKILATVSKK
ncbi:MAG: response regulator [Patescibacteria group bacterium]